MCITKISNGNQTVVPAKIRKLFNLVPGDRLIWNIENDKVIVEFKKKVTAKDIAGIITGGIVNAKTK
jgi:AbrB family looped-hinge helix DNA binding protein